MNAPEKPKTEQPAKKRRKTSSKDFPVVGLGASAGGLKALLQFFEHLPATSGMAFVVILHLSPKHESNADIVLQNATRMPVTQVNEAVRIEPNHVYVIPPTKDLSVVDGFLRLSESERPRGRHVAIDLFFRTLADTHKERTVCVVLSGTGSDGAVGLTRIKEEGGITFAQSPEEAEYDSMPRSAIATGMVDFVLPVAEMPQRILQIWENAHKIELPPMEDLPEPVKVTPTADATREAEVALRDILTMLRTRTGHDFSHYKRATVLRRIERRLQINHLRGLPQYHEFLLGQQEETQELLKDLLISVTNFFRDRVAFEALEREVIPQLLAGKKSSDQVRVWAPGCATGEEAYSLAMLLLEYSAALEHPPEIQVFATDLDEQAIATAREGAYPESIVTDVPPTRLRNFFTKEPDRFRIRKDVREKILFATHNLIKDPPFSRLDLISCRNLLIYLNREMQREVLELLHFALRPGGFLFLGGSESADAAADLFTPTDKKHRIYRGNIVSRADLHVPALPLGTLPGKNAVRSEAASEHQKVSFGELHQKLLEQYAPPSVIVNHDYDIVHLSDRAGRFLHFAGGEPSHNLLKVVHPELRLDLRTALFQAIQTEKSVEARRVRIERGDRTIYVNMIVRPVRDPETMSNFVLVLFDEVQDTMSTEAKPQEADVTEPVMRGLEEELYRTKEQLQATIEQHEASAEELKASNEELQAINEELRSTTEELETSKEELQSINEELTTVNQELRNKVEETGRINDDLQNLIASTDIATIFIDRALRIKRYTPRATDIFNIIPKDVGRSLLDITNRLSYESLAEDTAEVFNSLRLIEREVQATDGRWYIARFLPYRTLEDRIDGAVVAFVDITGRRQAEEIMRLSEERLRLLIEGAKDYAIFTIDAEGRINTWSNGAERIFGYAEGEAIGQSAGIIFTPEDRKRGIPEEELRRAREQGRAEDERWHLRKDGTRLYCSGVMTPLRSGEFHGYAKIARDLTEHRKAEMEREELLSREQGIRADAESANRLKDEFLAILSHELKHPLNFIQMNAEVLARLPEDQAQPMVERAAENIRRAVRTQAQLIDDLLDLSRIEQGKLMLNRQSIPLPTVVTSAVEIVEGSAAARQITLDVRLGREALTVEADVVRLEQVVWNLLSNAIKFTPEGGRVTVSLEREGAEARLMVEDTGQGIEAEFLPHVFEMFQQASTRTTRQHGGLGIGLALVKQLTEMQGGRVTAESEGAGRGARFTIWLPLKAESAASAQGASVQGAADGVTGLRLLVVDDTPETLEMMQLLLQMQGATVVTAESGEQALRLAEARDFDAIISDVGMPEMDGYELISRLRELARNADTPAVALTGFGRPGDVEKALASGFAAHVNKPIDLNKLIRTVSAARRSRPESASSARPESPEKSAAPSEKRSESEKNRKKS